MCIKIQIKVCIFQDESILILYMLLKKTSITSNGSSIEEFLTVYFIW